MNNYYLPIFIVLFMANSCGDAEKKIDLIYGEWKVEDLKRTSVNEDSGYLLKKEYYLEFRTQNFGTRYNLNREATNDIRWAYQEGGQDRFMLSTLLDNPFGSGPLAFNSLFEVRKLEKDKFLLTQKQVEVRNDTTFITNWDLNLTRD